MTSTMEWMSAHLYFEGDPFDTTCDRILLSFVQPVVTKLRTDGLVQRAFFVRFRDPYPDPRSHVRLRLLTDVTEASKVTDLIERQWNTGGRLKARGMLRWTPYERETQRYGGIEAMPAIEHLFEASSTLAGDILTPSVIGDRSVRLGKAMLATIVFFHHFFDDRREWTDVVRRHAHRLLHTQDGAEEARVELLDAVRARSHAQRSDILRIVEDVEAGDLPPGPFSAFGREVSVARGDLKALCDAGRLCVYGKLKNWGLVSDALAGSLVHMTNNRIGIERLEENLLTLLLWECLND